MTRYVFDRRAVPAALRDEMLAAGITPSMVQSRVGSPDQTEVDIAPEDFDRAATVVAAHDAAARDADDAQRANLLRDAKATLRTYYVQSPATITNAQSVAALKALIVAVRALAQLDN